MACSTESWIHARNATTMCPHPAITNCAECETPLCSAHIAECSECGRFLCRECEAEHAAQHATEPQQRSRMTLHPLFQQILAPYAPKQTFYEEEANKYYPQGCQCHDDSGSCNWCRVYYGEDKPWIDEEGRYVPLPVA